MQKFPHWTNCIRLSRIALSFVDAYIHTYLPTYIHTWTYENMNLVLVRIHCQLAGITVATGPRPIYAINPILMQQTAPERTDSRRNQGFCGGHRIRSLNASNDQPFVGPWLPGLPHWIQVWFKLWHQWDCKTNPVIVWNMLNFDA